MPDARVAVVTGTRQGIGRELALHLVRKGWAVAGCSRGPSTIDEEAYTHEQVDVGDEGQVRSWIRAVRSRHGRIDAAVCNAGAVPAAALVAMTRTADVERVLRTNVLGTFLVCREVARVMALQRSGRIVTMSSMAAGLHQEGAAGYAASKAAVEEFTRVLARELAASGVTCNVVAPSILETDAVAALGAGVAERAMERLTIKRYVTTAEVAAVVDFYLRPESASITGQVLYMGLVP